MPYSPHIGRCRKGRGTFPVGVWRLCHSPQVLLQIGGYSVLVSAEYDGKLYICIFSIGNNKNDIAFQRLPEEKIQM